MSGERPPSRGDADLVRWIDPILNRRENEYVDLLKRLISTPSVNPTYDDGGTEEAAQIELSSVLRDWGIASELRIPTTADLAQFVDAEPAARRPNWEHRPNLLASIGDAAGGHKLLLNGHIDVVGVSPNEAWTSPPFEGQVRGTHIYGRGAADDKGPLCALACALAAVKESGRPLRGQALFTSVVDEEQGGGGTLATIGRGVTADAAIVAESTELAVTIANRSNRRLRVTVVGSAAHSGEAFRGVNAILKAFGYIDALFDLAADLDRRRPSALWAHLPAQHVFNLNGLSGGAFGRAGTVPDRCMFEIGIGGTIADSRDELENEAERTIGSVTAADPWLVDHPPVLEWMPMRLEAVATDPNHPFVGVCQDVVRAVRGTAPAPAALSAATDMRHLVRYAHIPSVTLGPGTVRAAHSADESLPLDQYLDAIRCYSGIIMNWCR